MSGSGKWIKSLISTRKTHISDDEDKRSEKSKKKWRLWRRDRVVASESRDYSDHAFVAAVATVVRAPPRDFRVVQREWAAIRIQTVFRGFLARQASRALKAVVRIQAIFRGRQVRKQAAVTLRCMQALVRVQARIRTRCTIMSSEGETPQKFVDEYPDKADAAENAERWCDSPGSMDEVRAKLQMRQEGAIKRDRALRYSRTQQLRSNSSPNVRTNKHVMSMDHQRLSKKGATRWSWLNSWMAAKPWEDRLTHEFYSDPSKTPFSMRSERHSFGTLAYSSEHSSTEVRRKNVTTKVSARPPMIGQITNTSSASTSDSPYSESSGSTSSTSASSTLMHKSTQFVGTLENTCNQKASYMNLTESTKAKQKAYRYGSYNMLRHRVEPLQCFTKSMDFASGESGSIAGSDPFCKVYKDLYPPTPVDGQDRLRNRRR